MVKKTNTEVNPHKSKRLSIMSGNIKNNPVNCKMNMNCKNTSCTEDICQIYNSVSRLKQELNFEGTASHQLLQTELQYVLVWGGAAAGSSINGN